MFNKINKNSRSNQSAETTIKTKKVQTLRANQSTNNSVHDICLKIFDTTKLIKSNHPN